IVDRLKGDREIGGIPIDDGRVEVAVQIDVSSHRSSSSVESLGVSEKIATEWCVQRTACGSCRSCGSTERSRKLLGKRAIGQRFPQLPQALRFWLFGFTEIRSGRSYGRRTDALSVRLGGSPAPRNPD